MRSSQSTCGTVICCRCRWHYFLVRQYTAYRPVPHGMHLHPRVCREPRRYDLEHNTSGRICPLAVRRLVLQPFRVCVGTWDPLHFNTLWCAISRCFGRMSYKIKTCTLHCFTQDTKRGHQHFLYGPVVHSSTYVIRTCSSCSPTHTPRAIKLLVCACAMPCFLLVASSRDELCR